MKKLLFFIVVLSALTLSACGGAAEATAPPSEISTEQAFEYYQNDTFFLDVRTQEEWNEFHAPNSVLIPLDKLPGRLAELPEDQLIVVVCRSGNRSEMGRDILLKAGFKQVTSMEGGLTEWAASGYPTTTRP